MALSQISIQPAAERLSSQSPETPTLELCQPIPADIPELPQYEVELESDVVVNSIKLDHASYNHHLVRLGDGTPYEYRTIQPTKPKSDTAIAMTTPWFTSINGHNMHTALRFAKLGYPVVLVGPEGSYQDPEAACDTKLARASHISLSLSAFVMSKIVDRAADELNVRPEQQIGYGESRAAMILFGLMNDQYAGSKQMVYAEHVAPCFPNRITTKKALAVAAQVPKEIATIAKFIVTHAQAPSFKHYTRTVDLNPNFLLHAVCTAPAIFGGSAGVLAANANPQVPKRLTLFKNDVASSPDEWEILLQDHDMVDFRQIDGSHLQIPYKKIVAKAEQRLINLRDQRGPDGSFQDVDYRQVFEASEK